MISGFTSIPRRAARTAASKIARLCISVISGYVMPQSAAAVAEHRVRLAQPVDDAVQLLARHPQRAREELGLLAAVRAGTRAAAGRAAGW
jgi:hypothetical protein